MREIPLTQGWVAWVDDDDYEALAAFKWSLLVCGRRAVTRRYAVRGAPGGRLIYMHRVILQAADGVRVDHVTHHPEVVDNRRSNLRLVTAQENSRNSRKMKGAASSFKGVVRTGRKWTARIYVDGKALPLGRFSEEEQAARAYDEAARREFGEHALLNFKGGEEDDA